MKEKSDYSSTPVLDWFKGLDQSVQKTIILAIALIICATVPSCALTFAISERAHAESDKAFNRAFWDEQDADGGDN